MSVVLPVPEVPTISRERPCISPGTTTRPRLSAQPRSPSICTPKGDRAEVVVAHVGGAADGGVHAPLRLALGALDLGRVDRLPPAGQVQRGGQQPDRDGKGELGPQERPGRREVDLGGADLSQPAGVAGEVVGQGRARAALVDDHGGDGGQGGQGELPPAQAGHPQQRLPDGPREQRDRAEQEQADAPRPSPAGPGRVGRPMGSRWPSWLSYSGRAGMAPAPGGPVAAPAGVVRRPAAPAPRVLGMPAHRPPP